MPSPFPGMDPYLEQPVFWSEFHNRLIVAISDAIVPSLLPRYYVGVETRTYRDYSDGELLIGIPDAVILSSKGEDQDLASSPELSPSLAVATQVRPQEVMLPVSSERKERYLEVREAATESEGGIVRVYFEGCDSEFSVAVEVPGGSGDGRASIDCSGGVRSRWLCGED
jgi:Protein of unknown function (DUF4058)